MFYNPLQPIIVTDRSTVTSSLASVIYSYLHASYLPEIFVQAGVGKILQTQVSGLIFGYIVHEYAQIINVPGRGRKFFYIYNPQMVGFPQITTFSW